VPQIVTERKSVNCNCVTFFIIRAMLLFSSEVMSYFNATTPVFQNKRFPQVMLPEYNEHFIIPLANFKAATKISESSSSVAYLSFCLYSRRNIAPHHYVPDARCYELQIHFYYSRVPSI
jgi:hypothetical protein